MTLVAFSTITPVVALSARFRFFDGFRHADYSSGSFFLSGTIPPLAGPEAAAGSPLSLMNSQYSEDRQMFGVERGEIQDLEKADQAAAGWDER
jgi:hypothetical protein